MTDWTDYKQRNKFYCSREWRALRALKLSIQKTCEFCSTEERPVPATEVHHLDEVQDNPTDRLLLSNCKSTCKKCHSRETYETHMKGAYKRSIDIIPYRNKWNLKL